MNNITLEEAKKHLNIESDFTDDDSYITLLVSACEEKVARELCLTSSADLATVGDGNAIPDLLKIAILLNVGNYYANREEATFVQSRPLEQGSKYLIQLYRDFTK